MRNANSTTAPHAFLTLDGVRKQFDDQLVLDGIDLTIEQGEFFTLLGPSGCGKTTLLRIIAGFERGDAGRVSLRGRDLAGIPPERRPFNMVFQSYALFPHMSVADNVAYGLRMAGVGGVEIARRVSGMLELVHLDQQASRSVRDLSGGQQQRVALARALVNEPEILLLDEPLGALDLKLRKRLQEELRSIQARLRTTFVYVTHDQEEALTMSRRIGVMDLGRLIQIGGPQEIYDRPRTRFVAEFVGEANLVPCQVVSAPTPSEAKVRLPGGGELTVQNPGRRPVAAGDTRAAMVRPEHLELSVDGGTFAGTVRECVFLGTHVRVDVDLAQAPPLRVLEAGPVSILPGDRVYVRIKEGKGILIEDDVDGGRSNPNPEAAAALGGGGDAGRQGRAVETV